MTRTLRTLATVCVALGVGLVGAAPAGAVRAYVDYDSLVVAGLPGQNNKVLVRHDPAGGVGATYLITDKAAMVAGRGCELVATTTARCALEPDYPYTYLSIGLNDGDDVLRLEGSYWSIYADGGSGNDRMDFTSAASPGFYNTWFSGGGGDDDISVANGFEDNLDCGPGHDSAAVDSFDARANCETWRVCEGLASMTKPGCLAPGILEDLLKP